MGNRFNPGCNCCGPCNAVTLHPPTDWDGWTNPQSDTAAGTIPAGVTTSIDHDRATGNWVVDIEVNDSNGSDGVEIQIHNSLIEIVGTVLCFGSNPKTGIFIPSGDYFWIRHVEANDTIAGYRHRKVEIWDDDPDNGGTLVSSNCLRMAELTGDDIPDSVLISITAGDESIDIGTVRVSDTEYDTAGCTAISCSAPVACASGGPKLYLVTQVRAVISGIVAWGADHTYTGKVLDGGGGSQVACTSITQRLDFDFTSANGTYLAGLYEIDGGTSTLVTDTATLFDQIRNQDQGCAGSTKVYQWSFAGVTLTTPTMSYTDVSTSCASKVILPPQDDTGGSTANWTPLRSLPKPYSSIQETSFPWPGPGTDASNVSRILLPTTLTTISPDLTACTIPSDQTLIQYLITDDLSAEVVDATNGNLGAVLTSEHDSHNAGSDANPADTSVLEYTGTRSELVKYYTLEIEYDVEALF